MKIFELKIKYVDEMKEDIQDGILYISKQHGVAIHNCACGCGQKTVTDLQPNWRDGWTINDNN